MDKSNFEMGQLVTVNFDEPGVIDPDPPIFAIVIDDTLWTSGFDADLDLVPTLTHHGLQRWWLKRLRPC